MAINSFPNAYGGGSTTTGGRGGAVIHVTNLNDSGTGSLRAALTTTGTRTIVFDVSGQIDLLSQINLTPTHSNFTVAGQTAPQGGITITGFPIDMGDGDTYTNNIIFRHIRFRNSTFTGVADVYNHSALITQGCVGMVIDHCSFSFNDDQAISFQSGGGNLTDISIQNCIFSENATGIILGLTLTNSRGNFTTVNNLFVDQTHRTPNLGADLPADVINNVMFNFQSRLVNFNTDGSNLNFIGNYMKIGSYSVSIAPNKVQTPATPLIYTANNYHSSLETTPILNDQVVWGKFSDGTPLSGTYFTTSQHTLIGRSFTIKTAAQTYTDVLADVGANKYLNADGSVGTYLDSFDTTKIANVISGTSSNPDTTNDHSIGTNPTLFTSRLPTLPNNTRTSYYGTNQHIPAAFLTAQGVTNTTTVHNDLAPSGYTWMEEFLNQVDGITSGNVFHSLTTNEKGRNRYTKLKGKWI
jgi:hypothetical protein